MPRTFQNSQTSSIKEENLGDAVREILDAVRSISARVNDIESALHNTSKPQLTVEEVAQACGRSAYTVRRWITQGRLTAIRIGGCGPRGRLLIDRAQLRRLLDSGLGEHVPAIAISESQQ